MNNLLIIMSACLCLSFSSTKNSTANNPINHVVSYESYTSMSLPSENGDQECLKNVYLFSNHTEKSIEVKYKDISKQDQEIQTVTLLPLVEKEHTSGRKQRITRPQKIGEVCDFNYEIVSATYVE